MTHHDNQGLVNIAASRRHDAVCSAEVETPQATSVESATTGTTKKPSLELEGRGKKTSIMFDAGMWRCAEELAFVLTRKLRETGSGKVTISKLFVASFTLFHEKSLDDQLELLRKHL